MIEPTRVKTPGPAGGDNCPMPASVPDFATHASPVEPAPPPHFGQRRYYAYNDWVRQAHGGRLQKVSVAAGLSCPNRDGTVGRRGCSFCNNAGFTPGYLDAREPIASQIDRGLAFMTRRYPDTRAWLAYFQTYSNTWADIRRLEALYREALAHPAIGGLAIGTRPDCLPDPVLDLLAGLARDCIVELEVGIESTCDAALLRANRGHDFAASVDAVRRAADRGLFVTAHMILGLPGETHEACLAGAGRLSALPLSALKLHQLQVVRGTRLARAWRTDPHAVPLYDEGAYIALLADFVERLSPAIRLQRLGSEVPPRLKLAPNWSIRLSELAPRLDAELRRRATWQGYRWSDDTKSTNSDKTPAANAA